MHRTPQEGNERTNWLLGAFYIKEEVWSIRRLGFGEFGGTGFTSLAEFDQTTQAYAAFGQVSYDLTDRLTLTGGARLGRDNKKVNEVVDSGLTYTVGVNTFEQAEFLPPSASRFSFAEDEGWTIWSGKIALDYQVTDDAMVYGSFSRGVKSGGFNTNIFDVREINTVEPEVLWSYEAGFRSQWLENRVTWNGTVFFYDFRDFQQSFFEPDPMSTSGFTNRLSNAPKVHLWGAEIEFVAQPTENLLISLGGGYVGSEYKEFVNRGVSLAGNERPIPKFQYNGLVQYDLIIPNGLGVLTPSIDWNFVSTNFDDPENTPAAKHDSHFDINLRLQYTDPSERYSITGFVENVTNEIDVDQRTFTGGFGSFTVPTLPRTYGVQLRAEF